MTNIQALESDCKTIISTFYVDEDVLVRALERIGLDPFADNIPDDNIDFKKQVLVLCGGFVDSLRIEGNLHMNTDRDSAKRNVYWWARNWGLNPDEFVRPDVVVTDRTNIW